ncbi:twin-arginine translocase subunit TatC [Terricaulis silvestris]|uniref:Sec-independent protein translocase protein TatC n=1 Tax=Terricaulis silvestris TaxID=2686094 RepID=A0A6I6MNC0_9CAUL|nr:twin-arginine translocase subunit TatC [Terricaulis silvestris]QGZ94838.1 Sec-independent protein translocase protein TatC [Terricaulis silvestris]
MSNTALKDDEEVEASRAPLLDHLAELRNRLMASLAWVVLGVIICFFFADKIFLFMVQPFQTAMASSNPENAGQAIELINTGAFGFFSVKMQIALFGGIIFAFPIIAWQAYAFIAPGLYKKERAAAAPFMVAAPIMFALGAAFVFYVAMPMALIFALGQQVSEGPVHVRYLPKVEEYMGLVTTLVLAFGLMFQMPVVLSLLGRVGIVSASALRKGRRYAIVGIAAFSALVTPNDVVSMVVMAVPVYLLYEISIWIVAAIEAARSKREKVEAAALAAADVHSPGP